MRAVSRSSEPSVLGEMRGKYTKWDQLTGSDRSLIRNTLAQQDFGRICAYCEQPCSPPSPPTDDDNRECNPVRPGRLTEEETIDHFRPRSLFENLWLDWENLVYACYRCNQSKCNQWPEASDQTNLRLAAFYHSYEPVDSYVNSNQIPGQRPANEFFDFKVDFSSGEITPEIVPAKSQDQGGCLTNQEQSMALRTINDIDLNDVFSCLSENDRRHLWERRRIFRDLLVERLNTIDDFDTKLKIAIEFMLPHKPFSQFIRAYMFSRFPSLRQLLNL